MSFHHSLLTLQRTSKKEQFKTHQKNKSAKAKKKAIRLLMAGMLYIVGIYQAGAQCDSTKINFSAATSFVVNGTPLSITSGDFDKNGKLDLAAATDGSENIYMLLGTGTGSFSAGTHFWLPEPIPTSITSGDFNGDGKLDLATASSGSYSGMVLLNDDYGSFRLSAYFEVGALPEAITSGDFNGDGILDLATANLGSHNISILLGIGGSRFGIATHFTVGTYPKSITTGDFNGDGNLDLATANLGSNDISVLLGDGAGGFAKATNVKLEFFAQAITSGDFNGDGIVDLITANAVADDISVLLGNGTGSFSAAKHFKVDGVGAIISGDFNKDGKLDVAAGYTTGGQNRIMVLLNSCNTGLQGTPNLPPKNPRDGKNNKVLVCHNGKTLRIAQSALLAHLRHGDKTGACSAATSFTKAHTEVPAIMVYPNPNNGQFTIALQGIASGKAQVSILDSKGVVVQQIQTVFSAKTQTLHVNLKGRSRGTYLIKVESAAGVQTQKAFVQ